ncbi:MAG: hypothetical protein QOI00_2227, partial [Chloroflexota bacterium]|nr:hypothetical protein [Chloroflexota bacterium]
MTPSSQPTRRPRIAYLSYSSAEFDSRTQRMARSAIDNGYDVVVYARWEPGLAVELDAGDYRVVRVPIDLQRLVPRLLRPLLRRSSTNATATAMADATATPTGAAAPSADGSTGSGAAGADPKRVLLAAARPGRRGPRTILAESRVGPAFLFAYGIARAPLRWWRQAITFPLRPMAWAAGVVEVAEPADLWHGMWAGSLPALARLRARHGGRTIYDSRDIYLHARFFSQMGSLRRALYQRLERRWAQAADAVLTVNEPYADILTESLRIPRPEIVMNCPVRWQPPEPRPDLIRERVGLPAATAVVLYQGNLMTERGIEESMVAIQDVPNAALALLGYGGLRAQIAAAVARPPLAGRVFLLDAVPPSELLRWTASADVMLMAIQPTTLNHRHTTPQKLFEALAAGVPIVASDLPAMAAVVTETGAGVLCDPTSPASIAAAIRSILDLAPAERHALRTRALRAAHDRYNWERQTDVLFRLYRRLLGAAAPAPAAAPATVPSPSPA